MAVADMGRAQAARGATSQDEYCVVAFALLHVLRAARLCKPARFEHLSKVGIVAESSIFGVVAESSIFGIVAESSSFGIVAESSIFGRG